jgi:hypothetical protein
LQFPTIHAEGSATIGEIEREFASAL